MANPGGEVLKKLNNAKLMAKVGQEWFFLTVGEAVEACNLMIHNSVSHQSESWINNVIDLV